MGPGPLSDLRTCSMSTPVLTGNESDLWSSEVFTQTVKSAGNELSTELISFIFTQQKQAHVHAFETSADITDQTNKEVTRRNTSGEL